MMCVVHSESERITGIVRARQDLGRLPVSRVRHTCHSIRSAPGMRASLRCGATRLQVSAADVQVVPQLGGNDGSAEGALEHPGEGVARLGFAVDQNDAGCAAKPPAPVHQTSLIGVGGQSAQGMDTGGDLDLLAPEADELGTVDQGSAQGAARLEADDDDVGASLPGVVGNRLQRCPGSGTIAARWRRCVFVCGS